MANNEFTMNYKQANETQLNIEKIISDLQQQNNELSSEISRLSSCRGTKENPHNHDAEIAALSAQIQTNNNWINQLSTLKQGIADLTALAQATDKKLVTYLTDLFCRHREEQLNSGINSERKAIDNINKQIASNPNMPDPQKDAMLDQIRQHQVNITTKQKQLNEVKEKEAKNEIEKAKLKGVCSKVSITQSKQLNEVKAKQLLNEFEKAKLKATCPEQLDAMIAAENAKNVNEKNSFIPQNNVKGIRNKKSDPHINNVATAASFNPSEHYKAKDIEAQKRNDKIMSINVNPNFCYCQTGGWPQLYGDGSSECCRTALATMASINSNSVVTPNDTTGQALSVKINNEEYKFKTSSSYDVLQGSQNGYTTYTFKSDADVIAAINCELEHGRSVELHTTSGNPGEEHWVTVTGTINKLEAHSIDDLVGIDPWYNGANKCNPLEKAKGNNSDSAQKSGIIKLSDIATNKKINSDLKIRTLNVD